MSAVRPTGEAAYTDGTGTFHPEERRIVDGRTISGERIERADVCVIGSGAGGAVVAKEMAEAGMRVVMLEEGGWHESAELTARPREMLASLYRDAGQTATIGTPPIVLPVGKGVGGTTFVNSGTCFRTPAPVLAIWRERFGLELDEAALEPWFRRVERELNVSQVPASLAGRNALIVKQGAEALGWSHDFIYRNVRGCVGSGVCAFGCPSGAKQHVGVTYVPKAWAAGATTFTHVRAGRIEVRGGRARAVLAAAGGGGTLRVEAGCVVVACGALHTPLLLKRSGLGLRSGELGANLAIHPATALRARFDDEVRQWEGVPQSLYIDEFAAEGIMFEGISAPPDQFAMSTPCAGPAHRALMEDYARIGQFGVMVSDTSRGRVHDVAGRPVIRYDMNTHDAGLFQRGFELLAELYFAAGAREVHVPAARMAPLRDGDLTPLRSARLRPADMLVMAFHPLGTARAGADPRHAVLDGDLRVHGVANVHVADASAIPSSLGVNPQITIMSLATRLAFHLAGRPAPTDEPAPEHIARPRIAA